VPVPSVDTSIVYPIEPVFSRVPCLDQLRLPLRQIPGWMMPSRTSHRESMAIWVSAVCFELYRYH
jgi:hypothetical protein